MSLCRHSCNRTRASAPRFAAHCSSCCLLLASASIPCWSRNRSPQRDPPGQYDEAKVPHYTLPDPLLLLNGKKVTSTRTWRKKRRPEILKLFETNVYGRTMVGRPKGMTWEVTTNGTGPVPGTSAAKTVTIYFAGKKDEANKNAPKMVLQILLPTNAKKPVPVFLMPTTFHRIPQQVLERGYGFVSFDPTSVEPDNANGYAKSVRAFFAPPTKKSPARTNGAPSAPGRGP